MTTSQKNLDSVSCYHWQPWARMNLTRNPFGELTVAERVEVAVVDPAPFAQSKFGRWHAVELIGDCGRGKSTRLHWLQSYLHESVYVYLPEDEPIPAIPHGYPLIIDEAQRLSARVRRQVFASGIPLVLGTHQSLRRSLNRFGYQVQSIAIGTENSPELVRDIMNRRIEASRNMPGPLPQVSLSDARQLVHRFGSDIRSMEGFLYDRMQRRVGSNVSANFQTVSQQSDDHHGQAPTVG